MLFRRETPGPSSGGTRAPFPHQARQPRRPPKWRRWPAGHRPHQPICPMRAKTPLRPEWRRLPVSLSATAQCQKKRSTRRRERQKRWERKWRLPWQRPTPCPEADDGRALRITVVVSRQWLVLPKDPQEVFCAIKIGTTQQIAEPHTKKPPPLAANPTGHPSTVIRCAKTRPPNVVNRALPWAIRAFLGES